MSDSPYKIQPVTGAEASAFLAARAKVLGRSLDADHRKIIADGFALKGEFELVCREADSNEVAWTHSQENLITDFGRQNGFWENGFTNIQIGFAPSQEVPNILRCSIPTDGAQCVASGNLGSGVVTPSTYTKQWSTTFTTPPVPRTLGIIFTAFYTGAANPDANFGITRMWSYSLLTPPKTQTTTQTIEVVYKLSMNPIY